MRRFDVTPAVALAVYAHPDDADVAAGGSLATWALAGTACHLVVVCDGAKGAHTTGSSLREIASRRTAEVAIAGDHLGLASITHLERRDGEFDNDESLRGALVAAIRRHRPDVVLGPDPTATFFGGVYINHRDHRETGWALLDAAAPASAMPLYFPEAGPAHAVSHLLLSGTHEPTVGVDVSDGLERKVAAVLAHQSQTAGEPDEVAQIVRDRARQAGREIGATHGESFRHVALELE